MHQLTLSEMSKMLKSKTCSSTELTHYFLERIEKYDKKINSFVTVCPESALNAAKHADQLLSTHQSHHPLLGIPIAHKDLFSTEGIRTSSCSKMLAEYIAPYDATCVERLKTAGMIMLGKTNMDEFAMGSSNETSYFGPCYNPWNLDHVAGGSSGGSAAAVAAGLVPATTGTDTGGSIRLPAAYCGITGIKPSYGRISRWGMTAFASSLDQAGPMARTAHDCALLLETMSGHDPKDATSLNAPVPQYSEHLNDPINNLRIGLPQEFFTKDLDPNIQDVLNQVIEQFKHMGMNVQTISLPNANLSIPIYYILAPAEASSNLARFDGIRYGYQCDHPENIEDLYMRTRDEAFGDEVKRRIIVGTHVLASGSYNAYYQKAQKIRALIKHDFDRAFDQVDLIFAPTSPTTAFKVGEKLNDPVSMYLSDIYTTAANLASLPALTAPAGFSNGLPVGFQLIAPHLQEQLLLQVTHQLQCITDAHQHHPTLSNFEE
ncbi:MAG: Asp-tRNA(Asn)/Glu-tRNA(Gln) amidotransferase GatCAB subunit A [Legionellales bacterium]|nr:Asp-tRNA(Asn)/Glu-tRNA(Gln) amidotransferase GatCAB subunit A [Legionellales bacterium]